MGYGGYGLGAFLIVVGLVLALAVTDTVSGVDLVMVGWIMAAAGLASIIYTAVVFNGSRRSRTVQTVTHSDGTQTVHENRNEF